MSTLLGCLERVSLREIWTSEDGHFTPWLALPENLKLLGDAIGIDLELEALEKEVGPFSVDLLCKDDSGQTVVIENQIERTDHSHLGQLLTYAAGLKATCIVWIAKDFTDEHREALDWLNEKANSSVRFFGVEIEAWKIGGSTPAPKFNVVSKPKVSSDTAKQAREGLNGTQKLRIKFFAALTDYLRSAGATFLPNPAVPNNNWVRVKSPHRGLRFGFDMSARDQYIGAYICLDPGETSEALRKVWGHEKEFEQELQEEVDWGEDCISVIRNDDPSDDKSWPGQHKWMKEAMEKLLRAVGNRVDGGSRCETRLGSTI